MFTTSSYILGRTIASDPINLAHVFSTMFVDVFFVVLFMGVYLQAKKEVGAL